jgi:nucleoside-diphosphate-sugar epimerase
MTVLVTGGAGMIGARIVRNLLNSDKRVVSFDSTTEQSRLEDLRARAELVPVAGDICDADAVLDAVRAHHVTHVIHMAALLAPLTELQPALGLAVNVTGANNVFEAARECGVRRVVYPTSMAVYGDQEIYGERMVDEDSVRSPYNLYGHAKVMNEEVAKAYTRNFGLDARGLRIASVFGHGRVTGRSGAVARIISYAAVGEKVISDVAPEQVTPLIYVDDVAESLVRLSFADGLDRPVYVGGNIPASVQDIVAIVGGHMPKADIRFEEGLAHYPVIKTMDCRRIERAIDYRLPPLETRVLDQMNEARRERQLPELG